MSRPVIEVKATAEHPKVLIREQGFPGVWGTGKTPSEAAKNMRRFGSKNGAPVYVMITDQAAVITEAGDLRCTSRGPIYKGRLINMGVGKLEHDRD